MDFAAAQNYLVFSPTWAYGSDALLVWWSMRYGYRKLRHYADWAESLPDESVMPPQNSTF